MDPPSHDTQLRQAAFSHVDRLATLRGGVLDFADLAGGFEFGGERIPLINPRRGIFKPQQMAHLLSIKTVFPRRGTRVWYDDQREAHRQIYAGGDVVDYQFMGTDPNSADNRWLLDAMEQQIPVIYFLGTSPGHYQPIIPTFIVGWHPERLQVDLAFGMIVGASAQATLPASPERRYALREIKARLAPNIVPRCRPERLQRSLCDLPSARTPAARCRSHHHRCRRAIRTAGDLEWPTINEDPPCRLRCAPDRDRPRFPNPRL
jgi:putative restriction endonuclease